MPDIHIFEFLKRIEAGKEKFPINFLFGYNEFLGEKIIQSFCKYFLEGRNDFNYRRFYFDSDGEGNWEEIIAEAKSSNFFLQSRKIIVVTIREEKHLTLKKEDLAILSKYIAKPNPNTILIIYASIELMKDDFKQLRKTKIDKLLKEFSSPNTYFVDLDRISENEVKGYIQSYLKNEGISITANALDKIIETKEDDFITLLYQLPKLALADIKEKSIDSEDVEKIITGVETHSIWDLTDAIETEDIAKYLKVLKYLFISGIKPTIIIGTLVTHYNKLYIAKFLLKHNMPAGEIGKALGQHSFFLNKFISTARNFPDARLQHIIKIIYHLDYESKTSGEESARLSLQSFAFRIKSANRK